MKTKHANEDCIRENTRGSRSQDRWSGQAAVQCSLRRTQQGHWSSWPKLHHDCLVSPRKAPVWHSLLCSPKAWGDGPNMNVSCFKAQHQFNFRAQGRSITLWLDFREGHVRYMEQSPKCPGLNVNEAFSLWIRDGTIWFINIGEGGSCNSLPLVVKLKSTWSKNCISTIQFSLNHCALCVHVWCKGGKGEGREREIRPTHTCHVIGV